MPFLPPESFNVADYFLGARLREGRGGRVALRHDGGSLTYAEVKALADRFGQVLRGLGVRQEERVMIALRDRPEFVGALFGVLEIGAVVVMVNPDLKPPQVAALYDFTRARVAIVDAGVAAAFAAALETAAHRPLLLQVGGERDAHPRFEDEARGVAGPLEPAATHRDDPAIWLFSGGTTGRPKAVVQTHRSFANTTECYAKAALGYRQDDVTLSVPKLFFGYATGSNLFFPFAAGATACLFAAHPTAEVVFEQIRRHRPTILVNVPTLVQQMVDHPEAARQDLSCLRFATSAGEALPAPLYRRWRDTFGVELLDGLGTAEMWHIFVSNLPGAVRPGTLGRPVAGFEVRVCDEAGREVTPGEVGRLWVRGGSRAIAYWQDLEQTQEAFRGEWFVGGDLVARDADGYVRYCGRADDVLKVAGRWLAPQELESCLVQHPAVVECAVVGVENAAGLTKPYAFVVARGGAAAEPELEEALRGFVRERLESYKQPRRVIVVEALPRTHLGKVDRGKLRQSVAADD